MGSCYLFLLIGVVGRGKSGLRNIGQSLGLVQKDRFMDAVNLSLVIYNFNQSFSFVVPTPYAVLQFRELFFW